MHIRRAAPADVVMLTALSLTSKAYWGYDAAFMTRVASSFEVTPDYVTRWPVYVLMDGDEAAGFYGFRAVGDETFLYDMWLKPAYIGRGLGRMLWRHALQTAREAGYDRFKIESDPNAERFYIRMGASRVGEITSKDSGRVLPLLEVVTYPQGDSS